MPELHTLPLEPHQISAISQNEKILALIKADTRLERNALGANLPHPFLDTIDGEAFGGSPGSTISCIFLLARLGLMSHFTYLYNKASTDDKKTILEAENHSVLRVALQNNQGEAGRPVVLRFRQLTRLLANQIPVSERKDWMLLQLESDDLGVIRDALSLNDSSAALQLLQELCAIAPEKFIPSLERNGFYIFQEFCRIGNREKVMVLLKEVADQAPDKLPDILRAGDYTSEDRALLYGDLLVSALEKIDSELYQALASIPYLNPLPPAIFERCLNVALAQNNPGLALRFLSQYPATQQAAKKAAPDDSSKVSLEAAARIAVDKGATTELAVDSFIAEAAAKAASASLDTLSVSGATPGAVARAVAAAAEEAASAAAAAVESVRAHPTAGGVVHEGIPQRLLVVEEQPTALYSNLHHLAVNHPKLYEQLMQIERSPRQAMPEALLTLLTERFENADEFTDRITLAIKDVKYASRAALVNSQQLIRAGRLGKTTPHTRAREKKANAGGPKPPKPG